MSALSWNEIKSRAVAFSKEWENEGYLKRVKAEIESLMVSCQNNDIELQEVPKLLERDGSTIPQMIGEYFWVTLTKNCYPPSAADTVNNWAKWKSS